VETQYATTLTAQPRLRLRRSVIGWQVVTQAQAATTIATTTTTRGEAAAN